MKQVKRVVRSLLLTLSLVASFVICTSTANASSVYDDVFHATDKIHVSAHTHLSNCDAQDLGKSWKKIILNEDSWSQAVWANGASFADVSVALEAALENDSGLAVIERYVPDNITVGNYLWGAGDYAVQVTFTANPNNEVDFFTSSGHGYAYMHNPDTTPIYTVMIGVKEPAGSDTCEVGVAVARKAPGNSSTSTFIGDELFIGRVMFEGANSIWRQLFVNSSINYPSGYGGESISVKQPLFKYAGMGDSYSSGEGNPWFEYGTDTDGQNECHRSPQAYPRLLQNQFNRGATAFVACSGATTANITGGQWNEPAQVDVLTDETELITLTIGGNDVGFSSYVLGCIVACGPGTLIYNAMMDGINLPAFKANLIATYEEILEVAPNADLYVADYPYLAAENATVCQGLDFSGAYEVQEALNQVIHDAVIEVGLNSSRIFMVETNYPGSPFEGGYLCNGGNSLFNGVVSPPNTQYSLHPNVAGQAAYAEVFKRYIE